MSAITSSSDHEKILNHPLASAAGLAPPKEDLPSALRKMWSIWAKAGLFVAFAASRARLVAEDDGGDGALTLVARNI